jgi:hypothetical protein
VICFGFLIFVAGCKKDTVASQNLLENPTEKSGWEIKDRSDASVTTLGEKLVIPYKLDIMKQAYQNLYGSHISQSLKANYHYLRQ